MLGGTTLRTTLFFRLNGAKTSGWGKRISANSAMNWRLTWRDKGHELRGQLETFDNGTTSPVSRGLWREVQLSCSFCFGPISIFFGYRLPYTLRYPYQKMRFSSSHQNALGAKTATTNVFRAENVFGLIRIFCSVFVRFNVNARPNRSNSKTFSTKNNENVLM